MRSLASFVALSVAITPAISKIYTKPTDIDTMVFDYIVVGGGTAGNVIANRLTEDTKVTVLVLEAGQSDVGIPEIEMPLLGLTLSPGTPYDWGYKTVPQKNLNNRTVSYARGKVLGGSSSINYMVYNRGSRDDFDNYAELTGEPSLSWRSVQKYMKKIERYEKSADNHDRSKQMLTSIHSTTGMVPITMPNYPYPFDNHILATTQQFPDDFPFNLDMNSGDAIGIGWVQNTIGGGTRSSSASTYLGPEYQKRSNLFVLVNTYVTKVLPTSFEGGKPRFGAVEITQKDYTIRPIYVARKEVIVSAGTFNTPHLLLHSGIGDKEELAKVGINSLVHLPSVGKNMSDHALLGHAYYVNSNKTWDTYMNGTQLTKNVAEWNNTRAGPMTTSICNTIGFLRIPDNDPIYKRFRDPSTGTTSGHFELLWGDGFALGVDHDTTKNYMTFLTQIMSPSSRGTISINSSNPLDAPIIDPNFVGDDFDMNTLLTALKAANKFMSADTWKDYLIAPFGNYGNLKTDDDFKNYIRSNTGTIWHAAGTSAMSPYNASWGVVDPDYSVKGTRGLRVVDASVIPVVPSMHIQGVIYTFAERAAEIIKNQA